jgi:RNA recognition motif-containing protein
MDESQTAFASQYPSYGFDLDMMKRSMDPVGGPDAKKARWSPTFPQQNAVNSTAASSRDAFANYGYGPQASISQSGYASSPLTGSPLYSTPSLTINTQTNGSPMNPQMSPNTANFSQQQQPSPNGSTPYGFGSYNMLGMGMPGMNMNMMGGFPGYNGQMGGFAQQRLPSLTIPQTNPGGPQSAYSPVALSAALSASNNTTGRTVYVGNLPATASVDELLNLVHFGPLESIRVLPEKSCVFLSFLDGATAAAFHADATIKKLTLHGQELKIGWGKPSPVPAQVALAISQSNASRNVYLGGLEENTTEEQLRDDLSRFGLIDQVKIVRDKNIGFVHFLSISVANKVVNTLPTEPAWAGKRVNYGKDRCAYIPKSQQAAAQQAQAAAAQSLVAQSAAAAAAAAAATAGVSSPQSAHPNHQGANGLSTPFSPYAPFGAADALQQAMAAASAMGGMGMGGGIQGVNRTVYLGNIHPETTTEDLCNAIRGGVLQSIRYMQDKHIAFVTFIDPAAAFTFFQVASYQGMTLNNRRLKIGWGKNSGPLPPTLALAVHAGATRNVYIGNIEDFETFTEDRLKRDFGEYGDIELVNFLKEKNCAFVNFTNISNAIKAIDGVKNKPEYANLRIAHGKDRCANPPRSGPQGASGTRRSASGNGGEPVSAIEGVPFDAELAEAMVQQTEDEEAFIAAGVVIAAPEDVQQMHVDGGEVSASA